MSGNPITGREEPVNEIGIAIEVMQAAFIGLLAAVIATQQTIKKLDENTARDAA